MNSLSWFIYFVQTVDGLRDIAIPILVVTIMGGIIWGVITGAVASVEEEPEPFNIFKKAAKRYLAPIAVVAGIIVVFVPNRQTLLLIAGSEIGERVMKSEDVRGVIDPSMDLLKAWIKAETERLTKKDAK